mmetsp:Transcript_9499/g.24016  ORF Transcript_9499/g.24016 Transcript_9499/m.24016 type:complete len:300 (+) Transcript_9499:782-1681(+)
MRSRWRGSRFACSLNTNPENSLYVGSITLVSTPIAPFLKSAAAPAPPSSTALAAGGEPSSMNASRNNCTPKFVIADPKNTGVISPVAIAARSSGGYISPIISASSSSCVRSSESLIAAASTSVFPMGIVAISSATAPRAPLPNKCTCPLRLSSTPLKRSPDPMGHRTGQHLMLNSDSIWSHISRGVSASRSSLLTKVKMGRRRKRATSKSFRVCGSRPFAASTSMTALSAAARVRYVSSEKSWCPGVSRISVLNPRYSYARTVDDIEIPRCCSISIKSDVARRCSPFAFTAPAWLIAPP